MKPKIKFTSQEGQNNRSDFWRNKTMHERLAEGFRLTQKAYWQYYSQPNPVMANKTRLFVKLPDEDLKSFFERKNSAK